MKKRIQKMKENGFTLLELMVGGVIFLIGVLGFTGMVMMQARGNKNAKGLDEAQTLLQTMVEDLQAVTFNNLGNSSGLPTTQGLTSANVWTDGPMNKLGQSLGTGTGPYLYYRSVVVCSQSTVSVATGQSPQYCGGSLGGNNRPAALACSTITPALSNREKLIRILVSWTDRTGQCHYKSTDSLAFQ